jgi:hypothetical protein
MNNEHEGASWEGVWKLVYGICLLPVVLFPFWMLWGIIADVIIQPMLYPY